MMPVRKTKECPYCGEKILVTAIKCKHCGEFLENEAKKVMDNETGNKKNQIEKTKGSNLLSKILGRTFICVICGSLLLLILNHDIGNDDSYFEDDEEIPVVEGEGPHECYSLGGDLFYNYYNCHNASGRREGERFAYSKTGEWQGFYVDGKKEGKFVYYNENGSLNSEGNYTNDEKDGDRIYYDENGHFEKIVKFKNGVEID